MQKLDAFGVSNPHGHRTRTTGRCGLDLRGEMHLEKPQLWNGWSRTATYQPRVPTQSVPIYAHRELKSIAKI